MNVKRIMESRLFKNGAWLSLLQIFNTVVPLLTIPYITRILGVAGYGTFTIALNLVTYFQVIVEYGFGMSGARKVALATSKEEVDRIYSSILLCRILLSVLSFGALAIFAYVSQYDKETILCICILYAMVMGTTIQLTWLFQGKQNMKPITITSVLARVISVVLIFVMVKDKQDLYLYCFLYSITTIISSVICQFLARKQYDIRLHLVHWREILNELKDGWYLFTSSAMSKIFGSVGVTILGIVSTEYETGIYSAISKIPSVFILLFMPISQTLYPHISQVFGRSQKEGYQVVRKIGFVVVFLFAAAAAGVILLKDVAVRIAFGKEYVEYSMLLIPLLLWMLASIINNFLGIQILVASGRQREYSIAFIIGMCFLVAYNFILINLWKLWGIALATVLSEVTLTIILLMVIFKGKYPGKR